MKRFISGMVAALTALFLAASSYAIPATGDTGSAISVVTGQDEGAQPAKKPAKRPKRARRSKRVRKAPPASSTAPAPSTGSQDAPAPPPAK